SFRGPSLPRRRSAVRRLPEGPVRHPAARWVSPGHQSSPELGAPWEPQEGPSIGAVQWVDPYAEVRWPAYALAGFNAGIIGPGKGRPAKTLTAGERTESNAC